MDTQPDTTQPVKPKHKNKLTGILDSAHLIKMIEVQGRTYQDTADQYGVTKQAIHLKYQSIKDMFGKEETDSYEEHKGRILSGIEAALLNDLLDPDKRKKASLNNTAYAYNTIAMNNKLARGESTSNNQVIVLQVPNSPEQYKAMLDARKVGDNPQDTPANEP